jgi:hypothetical protein
MAEPISYDDFAKLELRGEKGSSLISASLTTKPLASSVYVRVPEASCPHKRSILVESHFPSQSAPKG